MMAPGSRHLRSSVTMLSEISADLVLSEEDWVCSEEGPGLQM